MKRLCELGFTDVDVMAGSHQIEVGSLGRFTWCNNHVVPSSAQLYRILVNTGYLDATNACRVKVGNLGLPDHAPLLLQGDSPFNKARFHVEHFWFRKASFMAAVRSCWIAPLDRRPRLLVAFPFGLKSAEDLDRVSNLGAATCLLGKKSHIIEVERQLEDQIALGESDEVSLSPPPSISSICAYLDKCYEAEHTYWRQRAKAR
ncbi:hypothetical protein Cni_G28203 [Canna indica]|uniref:Uncharacterized protein n=1 Tax=Canna indica TaxID=4628 RepID=A0AAQ3L2Y8_9LILI|nr:hypothetical protein Cni_G28203 [Canna indica]